MRAPEFWQRDGIVPALLSPFGKIWEALAAARIERATPEKIGVPVICIGNAVAGGAGKTPVAIAVAESILGSGMTPHFLSRGYGGSLTGPVRVEPERHTADEVGDEPLLLGRVAPAWIAKDRVAGARSAVSDGAQVVVMDDGFQNPSLFKDLSILVVDGGYGFGNGRIMPAGPLREPVANAVERAGAVAIIGDDTGNIEAGLPKGIPVLAARFVPRIENDDISGRPVVAFAGIGRPSKFFETLAGMGCELIETRAFPDHHPYTIDQVMQLVEIAATADAIPVTTEKDATRLPAEAADMVQTLRVRLEWRDGDALDKLIASAIRAKA